MSDNVIQFNKNGAKAVLDDSRNKADEFKAVVILGITREDQVRIMNSELTGHELAYLKLFFEKWATNKVDI